MLSLALTAGTAELLECLVERRTSVSTPTATYTEVTHFQAVAYCTLVDFPNNRCVDCLRGFVWPVSGYTDKFNVVSMG